MGDKFFGYRRENGSAGVRNLIAVIPSVFCAAKVAERIAQKVPGTGNPRTYERITSTLTPAK
jgi:altronate dehydratase large subunit